MVLSSPQHQKDRKSLRPLIDDPNFDRKLDAVVAGGYKHLKEHLLTRIPRENCHTIVDYIMAMQTEIGPSQNYRVDTIAKLRYFAEFHHPKRFEDITRQDVLDFLDKYRKPETVDPLHKWIGSYEGYRIVLIRFFKWLYQPDISHRNRSKPAVVDNIPQIKRKEISTYKPTDLWTEEDDALFYKYCPSSRDRCWHAMSRDTGCRPSELLRLKIKDVIFQQLENGYQIARITVNGKTGARNVRLCNSLPRLKDWLTNGHPFAGNPNSPLFCGIGKNNLGRRLTRHYTNSMYSKYRTEHFGKALLENPTIPEEDKRKIRDLVNNRRWNPYTRRHTAATEISKGLKDSVLIDQYMGWSHSGNTRQKYQHYFTDDAFDAMLVIDGLVTPNSKGKAKNLLKPRICPNCDETNKPEGRFCAKCKFVLSFDAFNESLQEKEKALKDAEQQKQELQEVNAKFDIMMANFASVMEHLTGGANKKGGIEIIPTDLPPELKKSKSEKEQKEYLLLAAETARQRLAERGDETAFRMTLKPSSLQ